MSICPSVTQNSVLPILFKLAEHAFVIYINSDKYDFYVHAIQRMIEGH